MKERVIQTGVDALFALVVKKGKISVKEAAEKLNVNQLKKLGEKIKKKFTIYKLLTDSRIRKLSIKKYL